MNILTSPYSKKQILEQMRMHEHIKGVIAVDAGDLIEWTYERALNEFSIKLIDDELLIEIEWHIVGHDGDTLHIEVSGYVDESRFYSAHIKNIATNLWVECIDGQDVEYTADKQEALIFAEETDADNALNMLNDEFPDAFVLIVSGEDEEGVDSDD